MGVTAFFSRLFSWLKPFVVLGFVFILGTTIYNHFSQEKLQQRAFVKAEKTTLKQLVKVTGNVVATEEAQLSFEFTGRLNKLNVDVGDVVQKNQVLAEVDSSDQRARLQESKAQLESEKAFLTQSEASIKAEEAKLNELLSGTRKEEIQIAEINTQNAQKIKNDKQRKLEDEQNVTDTRIQNAQRTVANARRELDNTKRIAKRDLDTKKESALSLVRKADVVTNRVFSENLSEVVHPFPEPSDISCRLKISLNTSTSTLTKCSEVLDILPGFDDLRSEIKDSLTTDQVVDTLQKSQRLVAQARDFVDYTLNLIVESSVVFTRDGIVDSEKMMTIKKSLTGAEQDLQEVYRELKDQEESIYNQLALNTTQVDAAEIHLNEAENFLQLEQITQQQLLTNAEAALNEAQNQFAAAQSELDLRNAGTRFEQIEAQQSVVEEKKASLLAQKAKIKQIEAQITTLQTELSKTQMRAPFSGVIATKQVELGEVVDSKTKVFRLISGNSFEVEAYIPEMNIAKVNSGDEVKITLDAYGDSVVFGAQVLSIDPAETLIDEVPNYRTVFVFIQPDNRIKTGMTANISIVIDEKLNALSLPQRALIKEEGQWFVEIQRDETTSFLQPVTLGFKATNGLREITSGLDEGQRVLLPILEG